MAAESLAAALRDFLVAECFQVARLLYNNLFEWQTPELLAGVLKPKRMGNSNKLPIIFPCLERLSGIFLRKKLLKFCLNEHDFVVE